MSTPKDRVRSAFGARRGRADDHLYARAMAEKAEITETYSVAQEISKSPSMKMGGQGIGKIEIEIPYDGRDYVTRQAIDDVEHGIARHPADGERKAIVGHLLLTDYAKTDLRNIIERRNQAGVLPLAIPVISAEGTLDLASDHQACIIGYDYRPDAPPVHPADLDIGLYDPDNLASNFYELDALTRLGETKPSKVIEKLRQEASFSSELLLKIEVRVSLPVKKRYRRLQPVVRRMSVGWPTITSLGTTRLYVLPHQSSAREDPELRRVPVRYNPVERRLEWEDSIPLRQSRESGDDGDAGVCIYYSEPMMLQIEHPGELFKREELEVNTEVEIQGYLLSGIEARLFDATGYKQNTQLNLITRLQICTKLYPADVFARRTFSPYHQFVFDDIVPSEMRITDIVTVLRNSGFEVPQPWSSPENNGTQTPSWLVRARRSQGPDDLDLLVAVEGKHRIMSRDEVKAESMVKISGHKESGQLKISVLGLLPRDHKELTRQMNALQQALRDRFRFQQTSRR
jgi:hypothetical protein